MKKGQSNRPVSERRSLRGSTLRRQQEMPATKAGSEKFAGEYRATPAPMAVVEPMDDIERFIAKAEGSFVDDGSWIFVGAGSLEAAMSGVPCAMIPRTLPVDEWERQSIAVHEWQKTLSLPGQAPAVAPTPAAPGAPMTPEEARIALLRKVEHHGPAVVARKISRGM